MRNPPVLVIGSGGREHALCWALAQSATAGPLFCLPGNPGTAAIAQNIAIPHSDHQAIRDLITRENIALTVIGPEAPLVDGLADVLRADGHRVLGCGRDAARLEGSKVFAKDFMARHGIPTAAHRVFDDPAAAKAFLTSDEGRTFRVLKADGLAAGKGVFISQTTADAVQAVTALMEEKTLGDAGRRVVIEEALEGPEVSVIALTDGNTILPFPASQDHKRAFDGDRGPNTGGMGAYAPTPFLTLELKTLISRRIFDAFLSGLKTDGIRYQGVIYFGLMLTADGPKVLEFNVRFGDPETQAILPLVDADLCEVFMAVAEGRLERVSIAHRNAAACTVVLASGGYPGVFKKGLKIDGLPDAAAEPGCTLFHAGTRTDAGGVVTDGGRVLSVTGTGDTLEDAVRRAYRAAGKIRFDGMHYRSDIAARAVPNPSLPADIKKETHHHVNNVITN